MAKSKNKIHYSNDRDYLKRLAEEIEFIGRPYKLDLRAGTLTVFALPLHHKKSPKAKREPRNKHAESAGRRT